MRKRFIEQLKRQRIRRQFIATDGVHIISESEDGITEGYDEIMDADGMLSEFPHANPADVEAYFAGKRDGFLLEMSMYRGKMFKYRAYFPPNASDCV